MKELQGAGLPMLFINRLPQGDSDGEDELLELLGNPRVVPLEELIPCLRQMGIGEVGFVPESSYLRVLHYLGEAEIAIDVQIRGNHIHHCTRGLWLDWQTQGTRVTDKKQHYFLKIKVNCGIAPAL